MTANHFQDIGKFEADLWKIADNLRANSNLASNEYFMPIMGLIFLRHATNRFYGAKTAMEADKAAVIMLSGSIERNAPASLAGRRSNFGERPDSIAIHLAGTKSKRS